MEYLQTVIEHLTKYPELRTRDYHLLTGRLFEGEEDKSVQIATFLSPEFVAVIDAARPYKNPRTTVRLALNEFIRRAVLHDLGYVSRQEYIATAKPEADETETVVTGFLLNPDLLEARYHVYTDRVLTCPTKGTTRVTIRGPERLLREIRKTPTGSASDFIRKAIAHELGYVTERERRENERERMERAYDEEFRRRREERKRIESRDRGLDFFPHKP